MYIIAKGECSVTVIDEKKNNKKITVLRHSDFCGEIRMMYGCKRTATVISEKYSTLATIPHSGFKDIVIEFPETVNEMKKTIFGYNDRMK